MKLRGSPLWRYFAPRVEEVSFRAASPWRARPLTAFILIGGLAIFGMGEALMVRSNAGAAPWTVFATGLAHATRLSLGWATFVVSCGVFSGWWPLRQRPGFGTIANLTVIPIFWNSDTALFRVPTVGGCRSSCCWAASPLSAVAERSIFPALWAPAHATVSWWAWVADLTSRSRVCARQSSYAH